MTSQHHEAACVRAAAQDTVVDCQPGCYTLLGWDVDRAAKKILDPIRVDWAPGTVFITPPGAACMVPFRHLQDPAHAQHMHACVFPGAHVLMASVERRPPASTMRCSTYDLSPSSPWPACWGP